jgi:hypothetical protein
MIQILDIYVECVLEKNVLSLVHSPVCMNILFFCIETEEDIYNCKHVNSKVF